jgi:hypothetical protein
MTATRSGVPATVMPCPHRPRLRPRRNHRRVVRRPERRLRPRAPTRREARRCRRDPRRPVRARPVHGSRCARSNIRSRRQRRRKPRSGNGDAAVAMAIQSEGKIVAAGSHHVGPETHPACLTRCTPRGILDRSFGAGGTVVDRSLGGPGGVAIRRGGLVVLIGVAVVRHLRNSHRALHVQWCALVEPLRRRSLADVPDAAAAH